MNDARMRLHRNLVQRTRMERSRIEQYMTRMRFLHPRSKLQEKQTRSAELDQKLRLHMEQKLERSRQRFAIYIERMKGLSPVEKLNKGFSYVSDESGHNVKSIREIQTGDVLQIHMTDGIVKARAEETLGGL